MKAHWAILTAAAFLAGCGGNDNPTITGRPVNGSAPAPAPGSGPSPTANSANTANPDASLPNGSDYIIMDRVRFLDQQGFDQPVEAFSMLFPKGWRTEGGVQWGNVGGCRGELVRNQVKASSPDGAYVFEARLMRSFTWSDEPMLAQTMQVASRSGGCQFNPPFNAQQFADGYARREMNVQIANLRVDEARTALLRALDAPSNQSARQNGVDSNQESGAALADITWPDGSEGILLGAVTNIVARQPNYMGGRPTTISTTVALPYVMKCPAGKRAECVQWLNLFMTSHRSNPIWEQAKNQFMTRLSQIEHASSMERIRLMGEQSRAYAKNASEMREQQQRSWESRQASQDASHKRFVQSIREVETWRDASGPIELSSGYSNAWSRGDGSYLLTNKPGFDPNSAFREQRWTQMQRER